MLSLWQYGQGDQFKKPLILSITMEHVSIVLRHEQNVYVSFETLLSSLSVTFDITSAEGF